MGKHIDLSGQVFGRWTVLSYIGAAAWQCRCACGTERAVGTYHLKSGASRSCGCYKAEVRTRHGMSRTKVYHSWASMRQRCTNPKDRAWKHYGGRGISVAAAWDDFAQFLADMGEPPSPEHEIDRIDNDGDYAPGNCRWATRLQQNLNRRDSARVEAFGEVRHRREWGEQFGINEHTITRRMKRGSGPEDAMTRPLRQVGPGNHVCDNCGKAFTARRRMEKYKRTYCSRACYHADRTANQRGSAIARKGWEKRGE